MMITMINSNDMVIRKAKPAILRLVNFKIFMRPTQMQTERILLRKMSLSLKYHPTVRDIPIEREISYMIRN